MPGIEQTEFSGHSNEICNAPATSIMYDNRTMGYSRYSISSNDCQRWIGHSEIFFPRCKCEIVAKL